MYEEMACLPIGQPLPAQPIVCAPPNNRFTRRRRRSEFATHLCQVGNLSRRRKQLPTIGLRYADRQVCQFATPSERQRRSVQKNRYGARLAHDLGGRWVLDYL